MRVGLSAEELAYAVVEYYAYESMSRQHSNAHHAHDVRPAHHGIHSLSQVEANQAYLDFMNARHAAKHGLRSSHLTSRHTTPPPHLANTHTGVSHSFNHLMRRHHE